MKKKTHTQLRLPADTRFLPLAQEHVRGLARILGLPERDMLALELAAEEAFENICVHAYADGTPGDVLVDGELLAGELRLAFHDEGLPFDPSLLERRDRRSDGETRGIGLKLIHNAVDEVVWENRGRLGKALRLVKRLPPSLCALDLEEGQQQGEARPPRAPEQEYLVRPLCPEDALQVTRLFWLTYGFSYKNEAFYRPEGVLDMVARGVLRSHVAVTAAGEVVAHAGLLRPQPVPMAEMALLVVSPAHRGRGLMERLAVALTACAEEMGLSGVSINPVTSHPVSQRESIKLGGRPCGLDLAACPPRQFKAMRLEDGPPQRESYLHCFKHLSVPPPTVAFAPKRNHDIVARIYATMERPFVFGAPDAAAAGSYSVSFDRSLAKGIVRVGRADVRQWPEIRRATVDLLDIAGAEVLHIELPLAQPGTPALWELAEAEGFFFTGVWPHAAEDGDIARLTRLAAPLDMGRLRLYSDFACELGRYVEAEMQRAVR